LRVLAIQAESLKEFLERTSAEVQVALLTITHIINSLQAIQRSSQGAQEFLEPQPKRPRK